MISFLRIPNGFDGNIAIKTTEGVLKTFASELKNIIYSSAKNKIAGAILKNDIKSLANKFKDEPPWSNPAPRMYKDLLV